MRLGFAKNRHGRFSRPSLEVGSGPPSSLLTRKTGGVNRAGSVCLSGTLFGVLSGARDVRSCKSGIRGLEQSQVRPPPRAMDFLLGNLSGIELPYLL